MAQTDQQEVNPQEIASFWQQQLALADKDQAEWSKDVKAIFSRYRAEKKAAQRAGNKKFNILFSNTEVLKSALYGQTAKPDVRRRFLDRDPTGRQAAEIVERGLDYCADTYDVDKPVSSGIHDYLLSGRGTVRIEYEPVIGQRPSVDPYTQMPLLDQNQQPAMEEYIADQTLKLKHVFWDDYRQCPARNWDTCWWVAYRDNMSRQELRNFYANSPQQAQVFGDPEKVPLNWEPDAADKGKISDDAKKADVWQIWDKRKRERIWIVKGYPTPLRIDPDPYTLADFFPQPEPIRSIDDTESLLPTPEFHEYRDQADDLDEICDRISRLTRALKRRGVYNQAIQELKRLARANDNEFIPVENYAALMEKGGLAVQFQTEDISIIASVLKELYAQRDRLVQAIYEITGIADIMRGATNPNETLGAQQMKAQFGSTRLIRRQRDVQKWIRNLTRLKAEILAEHFEPDVLSRMTQIQATPEIMQILRSDKLRTYRIDIETDSTVLADAMQEKKNTMEMIGAIAQFLRAALPAVQEQPALAPLMFELLSTGVRTFHEGRKIEEVIDQTAQVVMQLAQQPKPNPDVQKAQLQMQQDQQKHQMDMQAKAVDLAGTQAKTSAEVEKAKLGVAQAQAKSGVPMPVQGWPAPPTWPPEDAGPVQ